MKKTVERMVTPNFGGRPIQNLPELEHLALFLPTQERRFKSAFDNYPEATRI